jgi:hypothetical protein
VLVEDTYQPEQDKGWVIVRPRRWNDLIASGTRVHSRIKRRSSATRLWSRLLFLRTDDFQRDYAAMVEAGIKFVREPRQAPTALSLCSRTCTVIDGTSFNSRMGATTMIVSRSQE